jgi:hypothetical protein
LTVNATRRFRHTRDLRKLEERNKFPSSPKARLRASTCVLCAVQIFKNAVSDRPEGFGVGPNTLVNLLQARKYEDLHKLGGVRLVLLCSM